MDREFEDQRQRRRSIAGTGSLHDDQSSDQDSFVSALDVCNNIIAFSYYISLLGYYHIIYNVVCFFL